MITLPVLLLSPAILLGGPPPGSGPPRPLVLRHATVIDIRAGNDRPDIAVVIADGRIFGRYLALRNNFAAPKKPARGATSRPTRSACS